MTTTTLLVITLLPSDSLSSIERKRFDLADDLRSYRECERLYSPFNLTGITLVSMMLSSVVHRPLDHSWFKPFMDKLESKRCENSSLLLHRYVVGLFAASGH
ncbi:hypothetical protein BCV72DRAFT_306379 [Rhizopus microsporus var. microsporus]|uniref:Uncharacterized protein n=2 Tax=Rhizopus microsporus TaxID=58291 RepID=A0A2G4SI87_RHIZD|nr:uncharacterized protein RHIMIDRAFT_241516 [Rhizopus microsporus ATCC 52813]ORE05527.1 hypothetical protein BCV72DRAFT_306379 [Rhizopus microsporus var. microsporus]PHZ08498.1 hypothetical protein RHIMIDRAFT_241516 [Rhizopus microsporus ATCC 52813]